MARDTDEYEIPKSWPNADLGMWLRLTIEEPNVTRVSFVMEKGKLVAQVTIEWS